MTPPMYPRKEVDENELSMVLASSSTIFLIVPVELPNKPMLRKEELIVRLLITCPCPSNVPVK